VLLTILTALVYFLCSQYPSVDTPEEWMISLQYQRFAPKKASEDSAW
jgi:hypothetical protein